MAFPLTEEQRRVVDHRGGELLVSAAAGSGKTRVLVERLLERVTGEGLDIDQFLVITYTKAAAAELRSRVALELSRRLAEDPGNRHLRRQTTLVYQARISTIHSFCAALLRESGHLLDLDPDARLCEESEGLLRMTQVLDDLLEEEYQAITPDCDFTCLVDTLSAGRDDSRLAQIVLDVYGRVQSHPNPEAWLTEQIRLWELEGITDVGDSVWGRFLLDEACRRGEGCAARLREALALARQDELLTENYVPSLEATLAALEEFLSKSGSGWDAAMACLPIPFPAVGRKRKRSAPLSPGEEAAAQGATLRVKALRDGVKEQLSQMEPWFQGDSAQLLEDLAAVRPAVRGLMNLVIRFQKAYGAEKRRRGLVDFSDLEHYAVALLTDPRTGEPTPLAQAWGARFAEVMVDEYQDTNQVQNAIFTAISQGGKTLFQVGDVKQSIYRFRLADPTIFLSKYHAFPEGGEGIADGPSKRVLSRNFRSRPQVLEGCNDLFRAIMSPQVGELDYTDDQALVPGAAFSEPEGADYALELNVLDLLPAEENSEGERADKNALEAAWAAGRIRRLLDQPLMIRDGDGQRPVVPSDIMILLRSPGVVLHHYIKALEEAGIPWSAEGGEDFFSTSEVNVALALLQVVDNPRQDVPLIAVLRSPVYGFDGDKLARLRANCRGGDFYTAVVQAAEAGDEDCARFLEQLEQLRFGAGERTCRQLIWHIYETTNLLGLFGALPQGQARQENLLTLYALAGQMEDSGSRSLFSFLLRLERLRASGGKITGVGGREGDGVSILSIHRSKGLERPVVLVCGLARRLNREDMTRPVLFHPKLGVGPKGLDRERMIEYPTLARQAVARKLELEMLSEEMRLLYVAMTRAQEKLILSVALGDGKRALERLAHGAESPVSPLTLEDQQSVGQWILLHALTRPEGDQLRSLAGRDCPVGTGYGPAWDIRWISLDQLEKGESRTEDGKPEPNRGPELPEDLAQALTWRYPWQGAVDMPSKRTATQQKGRPVDQEAAQEAQPLDQRRPQEAEPVYRPDFMVRAKGLTAAQRGSALHMAMEYAPLDGDLSREGIAKHLDQLTEKGFFTPEQRQAVDPAIPAAFFASPLGRRMAAAEELHREFKFSLLTDAGLYGCPLEGEEVLLQGVIDAWFAEPDGLVLVDFKSDWVIPGQEEAHSQRYQGQMEAYRMALERITGRRVKEWVLWYFSTGTGVSGKEKN